MMLWMTVARQPLADMAVETINVRRAMSRPSTSEGRERGLAPENMPEEAKLTKVGMSPIKSCRPALSIVAVSAVALLSAVCMAAICTSCEFCVPEGQMPRATCGARLQLVTKALAVCAAIRTDPNRADVSGPAMKARPTVRAMRRCWRTKPVFTRGSMYNITSWTMVRAWVVANWRARYHVVKRLLMAIFISGQPYSEM